MEKQPILNGAYTDIHRDLIDQCRKGDRVAQYRIYTLYSQAMYNICLRMVPHEEEARDLLQEAFIKAFSSIRSFRGDCTFGLWLKRIVVNQCISWIRKKKPVMVDIDQVDQASLQDSKEEDSSPDVALVNQTICELPDKARVIFTLFCLENYSHKEIARMLDITESTSKTQYHRARLLLKKKISEKILAYEYQS